MRPLHALPRALGAPAWALITLVASLVATRPTLAQTQRPTYRPLSAAVDEARTRGVALPAALAQRITVAFDDEPLAHVLDELARRSRLGIAYAEDIARAPRVRLRVEQMPVAEVVLRATRASGWSAWVDGTGQIVVRRDPREETRPSSDRAPSRISGYIRRADSREVIRYATITSDVDTVRTQSNADGFYFVRLPAGPHRLRIRALGFAPLDTMLDVGASATLDLFVIPVAVALARVQVVAEEVETSDIDPLAPDMSVARLALPIIRKAPAVLGEVDPIRSLTLLPGVSRSSDFSTAFSVRGGSSDQNLILLDEATIYNPAHILGFLSVFNADAVDDVTLHKGAIPARFGGRLSSVLDVRQREGNANEYAGTASIGLLSSRATVEGPLPKVRGSFLVAGRRSYADLFLKASKDSNTRNSVAHFYDLNAKANVALGSAGTVMASGYVGRDVFGASRQFAADWGNVSGTLRWNQIVANRLFSKVTLYATDYDYGLHFNLLSDSVRWTSRIHSRAVKIDETFHLDDHNSIEFGGELASETLRPGDLEPSDTTKVNAIRIPSRHGLTPAAYIGHVLDIGSRVSLRYGARLSGFIRRGSGTIYQYANGAPVVWNAAFGRYEQGTLLDSTMYGAGQTIARFSGFEPRFSGRVSLTPTSSVKASYARTMQYILLASRTNAPTPLDVWEPVGPYFKPERADQVALGWAATLHGGMYEVSAVSYA